MRLLLHVEPLHFHNRPFHYWAWLECAGVLGRQLEARGWEVRWAMNAALGVRAVAPRPERLQHRSGEGHGLAREKLALLHQEEIRSLYGVPNMEILRGLHEGTWPEDALRAHGALVRERLAGFEPDVIITWSPAAHLRAVHPGALILHTENGVFSRAPYPAFQFMDAQGLYGKSLLATHAETLRARAVEPEESAWLARFRERVRAHHEASTVFHELERSMRSRHRRLALLPLQFAGEAGFDLNAPFRNQGEYLWHVLERLPSDVGLIVTEHPTAHWVGDRIDEETRDYLTAAAPQARFVPLNAAPHAGQVLLHHVDAVISVSSSLGLQALLFGRPLISPGSSHLRAWAHSDDPAAAADAPAAAGLEGALAWLLRHYFVRNARWFGDAAWLDAHLRGMCERWRAGIRGLALHAACESVESIATAMLGAVPDPPPRIDAIRDGVRNGEFAEFDEGVPRGWELVPGRRARVRLEAVELPGGAGGAAATAVRVVRERPGDAATLLLQRLPDAQRLADAAVTIDFMARGPLGSSVAVYLYQQTGRSGSPPRGTEPRAFGLEPEWQRLSITDRLPSLEGVRLGEGHHTELVLLIPPEGEGDVEITSVRLSPARFE